VCVCVCVCVLTYSISMTCSSVTCKSPRNRTSLKHLCVLQCVAVCCSVLQCVAVCCSVCCSVLQCVLQCVAVYCGVLQCVVVTSLKEAAIRRVYLCCNMCCSVLQCVAVCCSVLQCVAVTSLKEYATRRVPSSTRLTHILLPAHKRKQNQNTKEINIKSHMQCVAVFCSHMTEEICHSLLHPFDERIALCTNPKKSKFSFPKELVLPKRCENSRAFRKRGLFLWGPFLEKRPVCVGGFLTKRPDDWLRR